MKFNLQRFNFQIWLAATAALGAVLVTPSAQAAELQTARYAIHHSKQTMTDVSARRYHRHYRPQVYYRPYYRPYYVGPSYYGPGYYRPYGYYYGGPAYYGWGRGVAIGFGF